MRGVANSLSLVFVLFMINLAPIVESQSPTPDIDLTCESSAYIDVYPGSTLTSFYFCTVTNSSVHNLEVEIEIESGIFIANGPGKISVAPGSEVEFQVSFAAAESGLATGKLQMNVQATVVMVNGLQPLTNEQEDANTLVTIIQYGAVSSPILVESQTGGVSGDKITLQFQVENTGNGPDKFLAEIYNRDYLESSGFIISMPFSSMIVDQIGEVVIFNVEVTLPSPDDYGRGGYSMDIIDPWQKDSSGEFYGASFALDFTIRSEHSCRYGYGGCYTESTFAVLEVKDPIDQGFLGMSSTVTYILGGGAMSLVLGLAIFAMLKRKPTDKTKQLPTSYLEETTDDMVEDIVEDITHDVAEDNASDIEDEFDFL